MKTAEEALCWSTSSACWGWDAFVAEANTGRGLKVRPWMKPLFRFVVPAIILFLYVYGMVTFRWK